MWEKSKSDKDPSEVSLEQEADEFICAAKEFKDRYLYESQLHDFIHSTKYGRPIPNNLMQFVADMIEELMSSQNKVKVSDVLGARPKGSQGNKSLEKQRSNKRIIRTFALNKLNGMNKTANVGATADKCGVSPRTIERIIRDYAKIQPSFKYRKTDKM